MGARELTINLSPQYCWAHNKEGLLSEKLVLPRENVFLGYTIHLSEKKWVTSDIKGQIVSVLQLL